MSHMFVSLEYALTVSITKCKVNKKKFMTDKVGSKGFTFKIEIFNE